MQRHPFPANPLRIIQVKGSGREIGGQHAEALGEVCRRGMPRFYHDLIQRMIHRNPRGWKSKLGLSFFRSVGLPLLARRLLAQVPEEMRERVQGFAEAAKLDVDELYLALVLPDLLPMLQSLFRRFSPAHFVSPVPDVRLGCSSFVSNQGRFLIGRNLDFPGVGYWDRYPVVQCTRPNGRLAYISFTTAGIPLGGITGINEAQVWVAVHQHYGIPISLRGRLPFVLGEEILQKATSLEDALEILQTSRLAGSWSFVLADGKSKQAVIWEGTPKNLGKAYLSQGACLAHSNFFQTAGCQRDEYATTARMNWDNYWRQKRLQTLVSSTETPESACKSLSDCVDGFLGEEKVVNRTVSQTYNIQSLVVDPVNMVAWIAEGDCPVQFGHYRQVDLGKVFSGDTRAESTILSSYNFQNPKIRTAKQDFILAFVYAMDGREDLALPYLKTSLEHVLTPEVASTATALLLRQGQCKAAIDYLERASVELKTLVQQRGCLRMPPEYFECRLFLARAKDLDGKPNQAKRIAQELAEDPRLEDEHLRAIAKRYRTFRPRDLEKLVFPFSAYVPFL